MKIVKLDDELYQYIASQTTAIGEETPSDILRRLLNFPDCAKQSSFELKETLPLFAPTETPTLAKKVKKIKAQPQLKQEVENLIQSPEFQQQTKGVRRFLEILTVLHRVNPKAFAKAVEPLRGHTRTYFATDEQTLLNTGNHTKPKQIPDSPFWVVTNTNRQRKMLILEKTMREMQLPESLIDNLRQYF